MTPDQIAHHIPCPQGKFKFELQGIFGGHDIEYLFDLLPLEFFRPAGNRFGFKRFGSTFTIFGKPFINAGSMKTKGLYNLLEALSLLDKFDRSDAKFFSGFVV